MQKYILSNAIEILRYTMHLYAPEIICVHPSLPYEMKAAENYAMHILTFSTAPELGFNFLIRMYANRQNAHLIKTNLMIDS